MTTTERPRGAERADLGSRVPENPLLSPRDISPSQPALEVVSVTGKCNSDDATVSVAQTATARAVYNLPGTSQPDRNLTKMQPDTHPQAWLAGVAPGSYYSVKFDKPGCAQLPYPVAYGHVSWLDGFRIQSKALTMVKVFIP